MNNILVYIEQRAGIIKKSSLEAASTAVKIGNHFSLNVDAVIIGDEVANPEILGNYGVNKVYFMKNSEFSNFSVSGYGTILHSLVKENSFDFIVFSHTAQGKDLAAFISAKNETGLIVDCIKFENIEDNLVFTRPIYAGKSLQNLKFISEKSVLTLRPNVFPAETLNDSPAQVIIKEVISPNLSYKTEEVKKSEGKIDVSEASVIVSGGRGMKGPEHFHLIEELAETLGAAVGASRAVVDAGWRPHSEQVGQTGKTVSPNLYIAVGISGAIQHLAGMRSSKYIVAINKDKDAPIFQIADYGITGDAFEILPELTKEIKKLKED